MTSESSPSLLQTIIQLMTLAGIVFLYESAESIPVCALSAIAQGLHISEAMVGALVGWYAIVAALTTVPFVWMSTRWSRQRVVTVLLGSLIFSQLISALAPNFWVLLAGRVLCAATHGLMWSTIAPLAVRLLPPNYVGRATTAIYMGSSLSMVIGNPLMVTISTHWGWRVIAAGISVAGLIIFLIAYVFLRPVLSSLDHDESSYFSQRVSPSHPDAPRSQGLAILNGLTFIVVAADLMCYPYIIAIIRDVLHVGSSGQVWFLALFGGAGLIMVPLIARPLDYYPRSTAFSCLGILTASFVLLFCVTKMSRVFTTIHLDGVSLMMMVAVLAICLWGAASNALSPIIQAIIMKAACDNPDRASGIFVTTFQVGITLGSFLGGLLYEHWGIPTVIEYATLIISIVMVVIGPVYRHSPLGSLIDQPPKN